MQFVLLTIKSHHVSGQTFNPFDVDAADADGGDDADGGGVVNDVRRMDFGVNDDGCDGMVCWDHVVFPLNVVREQQIRQLIAVDCIDMMSKDDRRGLLDSVGNRKCLLFF
jgi:hypothetical protein